jgi:DNA polymerase I-like protein with 3'-5' exonuclease and polymerase domains
MELPDGDLYVAFNAKFDLHWSRRLGFKLPTRVWCCQLAEFYLSKFTTPYPSLEDTAVKYGLGHKIDTIKLKYWDNKIDTDKIPLFELAEYANQDTDLTYAVYLIQREQFRENPNLLMSFKIACEDLLVLEEMEWNGLIYDKALCLERSAQIEDELCEITAKLAGLYPDVPINFSSGPQLSAFLYGGNIVQEIRTQVGVYKSGEKLGQPRYSLSEVVHTLPRLVTPLPKSELARPGVFATDEATLRKLKGPAAKKYVSLLLRFAELEKLNGTYYAGLVKLNTTMNWPDSILHGQFNQVVAKTGRLSSTKP